VGTVDVVGAEPGAQIVVDGRPRSDFPLLDPLRVSAGTHTIRLFKEGFRPFETRIDVAGGQTAQVVAKMPALAASGRLRVTERTGKKMDVVIAGAVVGVTPWEGSLAVGDQVVWLAGDGDLGTQPARVPVKQGEVTALTLAAEILEAGVVVEVQPASATISIDNVDVGRGGFDGRLRTGPHAIDVSADGFYPQKKRIELERGEVEKVVVRLERDEDAEEWRKPSRITLDLTGGVALAPSLGGDVAGGCEGTCSSGLGVGGLVALHGAYEFGSGLSFGLTAGFVQIGQSVEDRATELRPIGLDGLGGRASDELRLRGGAIGVHAGYRFFDEIPLRGRLGAGAIIGSVRSERAGAFEARSGAPYEAPPLESEESAAFVYVAPEVSVGQAFGDRLEIGIGVQALVLVAASSPTWGGDAPPRVVVPGDGLAAYPDDESLAGTAVAIVPGASVRLLF
jgi:hypothetical protein